MKLIVGLGNPGKKYERTRHNVGFMLVDELAKQWNVKFKDNPRRKVIFAKKDDVELIKPQTFMNRSGSPLPDIMTKHKVSPQDLLVISDDIDMELGKVRYRAFGSSGGHRGIQSIIESLGTDEFPRIKIGIGRSESLEPDKYVTSGFSSSELAEIKKVLPVAIDLIQEKFLI